jgi:hypothetical protein
MNKGVRLAGKLFDHSIKQLERCFYIITLADEQVCKPKETYMIPKGRGIKGALTINETTMT